MEHNGNIWGAPYTDPCEHLKEPMQKGFYCLEVDKKKQVVRLLDVFLIAPILIYAGYKAGFKSWLGIALIIIGAGTLVYNAMNLVRSQMNKL